ncbi:MAG TPA: MotA/TolQ/ExbB proton channel family protein [Gemmatimonadales bacterium]|nr:MotA/TolQ/ExbB proton channel family protein [Gemmatimonadales bacterium]
MLLQAETGTPTTWVELIRSAGPEVIVVLIVTGILSLSSWFIIGMKWWQFRRIAGQARRFFNEVEREPGLREAYRKVMKLPPSPFSRLFREGLNFYSELKPGAMTESERTTHTLTESQLEVLKMVLSKEVTVERDSAAHYVTWLATIGAVAPLLGLLGTVLGVMNAFLGIATGGSGNLAVVAPGVAEALITTVAGLAVAIPAVMAYNWFASKVGRFEGELEGFGNALVGWMAREGLL